MTTVKFPLEFGGNWKEWYGMRQDWSGEDNLGWVEASVNAKPVQEKAQVKISSSLSVVARIIKGVVGFDAT